MTVPARLTKRPRGIAEVVARFVAGTAFALCLATLPATAEAPWSIRFGAVRNQLHGDLARVYPNADFTGTFGASVRTSRGPWRVRTGLHLGERSGEGKVDLQAGDGSWTQGTWQAWTLLVDVSP